MASKLTIFCPPGPLPLRKFSVISSSLIFSRGGSGAACRAPQVRSVWMRPAACRSRPTATE